MYYWYYGTLAMFQVGGEPWKAWNEAMKTAIIDHQRKDGDAKGSWDPIGPWGRDGGRVYSTAIWRSALQYGIVAMMAVMTARIGTSDGEMRRQKRPTPASAAGGSGRGKDCNMSAIRGLLSRADRRAAAF